jgi:hypothetical protein
MPTPLKLDVINHLIAQYEGKTPPESLRDYMRAFAGGFAPDMKFTLHQPAVNKLFLYVYEENCNIKGIPRSEFNKRCKSIIKPLVEIAKFIEYLYEKEYITMEYKGNRMKMLPEGVHKYWRRYEGFYPDESEPIIFVRSIAITPARKLYELRETLAGGN